MRSTMSGRGSNPPARYLSERPSAPGASCCAASPSRVASRIDPAPSVITGSGCSVTAAVPIAVAHRDVLVVAKAAPTATAIIPSAAQANEVQASLTFLVGTTGLGGRL